jgi:hypothetical protein
MVFLCLNFSPANHEKSLRAFQQADHKKSHEGSPPRGRETSLRGFWIRNESFLTAAGFLTPNSYFVYMRIRTNSRKKYPKSSVADTSRWRQVRIKAATKAAASDTTMTSQVARFRNLNSMTGSRPYKEKYS